MFRISKNTDLLQILFKDLKMIRAKIIANSDFEIKKIIKQKTVSKKSIITLKLRKELGYL